MTSTTGTADAKTASGKAQGPPRPRWPRRILVALMVATAVVAVPPLLTVLGALPSEHVETQVDIGASPDEVWTVLADLEAYQDWNPFIIEAAGTLKAGQRLDLTIQPVGAVPMTIRPQVLVADPGRELRWLGRLGVPGIIDGEHSFTLQARPDGSTRVVHAEDFSGLGVPALRARLHGQVRAGFEAMNTALVARVEREPNPDAARRPQAAGLPDRIPLPGNVEGDRRATSLVRGIGLPSPWSLLASHRLALRRLRSWTTAPGHRRCARTAGSVRLEAACARTT